MGTAPTAPPAAHSAATVAAHHTAPAVEDDAAESLARSRASSRLSLASAHMCSPLAMAPLVVCSSASPTLSQRPMALAPSAPYAPALSAPCAASVSHMSSPPSSSAELAERHTNAAYSGAGVNASTDMARLRSVSLCSPHLPSRPALALQVDTDTPSFPPSALSPHSLSSARRSGPHAPPMLSPPLHPVPLHASHSPSFSRRPLGISPTAQSLNPFAARRTLVAPSLSGSTTSSSHDAHAHDVMPQPLSPDVARRVLPSAVPLSPSSQRRHSVAAHALPSATQPLSPALSRRSVFFLGSLPSLPEGEEEEPRNSISGAKHAPGVAPGEREWAMKEHAGGVGPAWGSERGFPLLQRPLAQSMVSLHPHNTASGAGPPIYSSAEASRSTFVPGDGPHNHRDATHAPPARDTLSRGGADWSVAAPASGASHVLRPARHTLADAHAFSCEAPDASFAGSTTSPTHSPTRASCLSVRGRDTFASHRESCERMSGNYVVNTDGVRHGTIHGGHGGRGGGAGYHNSFEPVIKSSSHLTPNTSAFSTPQHLHHSDAAHAAVSTEHAAASLPPHVEHATAAHGNSIVHGSPASASSRLSFNTASTLSRLRGLTLSSQAASPLDTTDPTCADSPPPLQVYAGAPSSISHVLTYDPATPSPLLHAAFTGSSRFFSTHQTYRRIQQQTQSLSQPHSHPQPHSQADPSAPDAVEAQLLPRLQQSHRLQSDAVQMLHSTTPVSLTLPAQHVSHSLPPLASHHLPNVHTQALSHPHALPTSSAAAASALGADGVWRYVAPAPALMPGPDAHAATMATSATMATGVNMMSNACVTASAPLREQPVAAGVVESTGHGHAPVSQMVQQATPLPQLSPAPAYTPSSNHTSASHTPSPSPASNAASSTPPAAEIPHGHGGEARFFMSSPPQLPHHSHAHAPTMVTLTPYIAKYPRVAPHAREVTAPDSLYCPSTDSTCISGSLRTQTTLLRSSSTSLAPSLAKTHDQRLSTASAPAGTSAPTASHDAYTYLTLSLRSSHATGGTERSSALSFTTLAPQQLSRDLYAHPSAAALLLAQTTQGGNTYATAKLDCGVRGVEKRVDAWQHNTVTDDDMNDDVLGFHSTNDAAPTPSPNNPSFPSLSPESMHAPPRSQLIPLVACPNVSLDDVMAMSAEELERLAATSLAPVEAAVRGM